MQFVKLNLYIRNILEALAYKYCKKAVMISEENLTIRRNSEQET